MEAKRYVVPTPYGEVSLIFGHRSAEAVTVFIHGAARTAHKLAAWLEPGTALAELPGHDSGPFIEGGVVTWAAALESAIGYVWPTARITLVGESLGGIIALHMRAHRVVALDPPMEPTAAVEREIRTGFVAPFLHPLLTRPYWSVLDAIRMPAEVICGLGGILPAKAIVRLAGHPNVRFNLLAGGHVLLDDNPEGVRRILAQE